jgi:SSS family solute:Na+ symporter
VNFGVLDGVIVGVYLLITVGAGLAMRRAVGSVEHFLVAGRQMDLFLGVASLAATEFGVITCMYTAEMGYRFGFAGAAPGILATIAYVAVGLTGFCIKPLRDAGVITVPEMLHHRFGPKVRAAVAIVTVVGGLLNMGLFLRMAGEFLVGAGSLKPGYLEIAMTAVLLLVALYTIFGGMLSVLITDFLQFVVMGAGILAITFLILYKIGWSALVATIQNQYGPAGFDPIANPGMGPTYLLYNGLLLTAGAITWQPSIARVVAAKDSRTGARIYSVTSLFFLCRFLFPAIWGMAALTVLGPALLQGESVKAMPRFLSSFVPTGLLGILIASMLAAEMSTVSSYMLTYSSIIYNDLISPFRRTPLTEARGLAINRSLLCAIGVFLMLYGLWYPLKGPLWNYISITATIHLSSTSVLLVACCYWKRATARGAAFAIALGAAGPVGFLVLQHMALAGFWKTLVRAEVAGLGAFLLAALGMIVGSYTTPAPKPSREEALHAA